ncbi:C-GCAxxG-C-C family protein [Collinsella tanakaei]|uniref:C-GCAxxG-C-C family protein n=1 Tax=Collinsella tanakaei TaxID=626935 RepID=UPI0026F2B70C|nr:C-GCAxxG-C-C family protein [Collinsella tanakaei]
MAINKDEIFLNRSEIKKEAARLHEMGYNCAQSVVCAMAPAIDLDADGAFVLAEGFGAGMGGMTETCGAVSGAVMALSQVESTGRDQIGSKAKTYRLSRELSARFASANGSTVCRELKGIGAEAGALRSCPGCIDDAIDLAVDILVEQGAHEGDAR